MPRHFRLSTRLGLLAWLGLVTALAPATAAPSAQEFTEKAATASMFGVESATLALQRTDSPAIKSFAHKLADDLGTAAGSLRQITARRSDIALPDRPDAKQLDVLRDLAAKPIEAFDRAYVEAQRTVHRETLSFVTDYMENGSDPELKAFAARVLPVLQELERNAGELPAP